MMLRINNEGSDYGSWEAGSYVLDDDEDDEDEDFNDPHDETDEEGIDGADDNDEDAFDVHAHGNDDLAGEENNPGIEFDPAVFSSDEAYARALQDAEDRDMAARLLALAGINDCGCSFLVSYLFCYSLVLLYFASFTMTTRASKNCCLCCSGS